MLSPLQHRHQLTAVEHRIECWLLAPCLAPALQLPEQWHHQGASVHRLHPTMSSLDGCLPEGASDQSPHTRGCSKVPLTNLRRLEDPWNDLQCLEGAWTSSNTPDGLGHSPHQAATTHVSPSYIFSTA